MATVEHDRQLRRAVTELAQCTMEDIEAVWSALAPDERQQLEPLLAQASRAMHGQALELPSEPLLGASPDGTGRDASCARLALAAETLPPNLALRLMSCLAEPERTEVLNRLTGEWRTTLDAGNRSYRISQRARDAFREAVLASPVAPLEAPLNEPSAPMAPRTLSRTIRRWFGRRG
ncbi:MAG TPA: hypothetical protein VKS80_10670 [Trinickia sp.]|nr:hypothetical protein [Trinickia sp.]